MRKLFVTSALAIGLAAGAILGGTATAQADEPAVHWKLLDGKLYDHYLACWRAGKAYTRDHGGGRHTCTGSDAGGWVALVEA